FTAANLMVRFGKEMATPPAGDGALPGTLRRRLLERLSITERSLTPADLERADEVVSVNSLGVRRLSALGGGVLPEGRELHDAAAEIYRDLR
ncbi:aminotransferase class IV, partial [Klebsiella pneumoniae]|nr:aminotransferase class IV [Klebsiella pneumoniae]